MEPATAQPPFPNERNQPHTKRYRQHLARKIFKANAKLLETGVEDEERNTTARADRRLREDHERSHAERGLLFDTTIRMRSFPSDLLVQLQHLFRKKQELSRDAQERTEDDQARRMAVHQLMTMREEAGMESPNEVSLWTDPNINITEELDRKFGSGYFETLTSAIRCRKSQRAYLEWCLQQRHRSGIPKNRVTWLREIINRAATLPHESSVQRMRAYYYILACRKAAGFEDPAIMESTSSTNPLDAEDYRLHQELMEKPKSFFENEPFELESDYQIEVDPTTWVEEPEERRHEMEEAWKAVQYMDDLLGVGEAESGDEDEEALDRRQQVRGRDTDDDDDDDDGGHTSNPTHFHPDMAPEPVLMSASERKSMNEDRHHHHTKRRRETDDDDSEHPSKRINVHPSMAPEPVLMSASERRRMGFST